MNSALDQTLQAIVNWANGNEHVRAALLTSTRARPDASPDRWSDYDVILVVRRVELLLDDRSWIENFGDVVVSYWDPLEKLDSDFPASGNVVQYVGELKIDFTFWSMEHLANMTEPDPELDAGYRVLLDKDQVTSGLPPASSRSYRVTPPDAERFALVVNDFYVGVPYVVKCLLRDDPLPARWVLDYDMRFVYLQPMLEWVTGVHQGWNLAVGVHGRGLNRSLPPVIWREVELTFAPLTAEATWEALMRMCDVFRRCGEMVAENLGYIFDHALHDRVMAHAHWMRAQSVEPRYRIET
jgi:aminoglycoside 6-adenylyltransferase